MGLLLSLLLLSFWSAVMVPSEYRKGISTQQSLMEKRSEQGLEQTFFLTKYSQNVFQRASLHKAKGISFERMESGSGGWDSLFGNVEKRAVCCWNLLFGGFFPYSFFCRQLHYIQELDGKKKLLIKQACFL